MIQVVEYFTDLKTSVQREFLLIGFVKGGRESPKHVGERKVSFPVPIVACRIENKGVAV